MSRVKKWLIRLGVAVGSIVLVLLLAEGIVRLCWEPPLIGYPGLLVADDAGRGFRLASNYVGRARVGAEIRTNAAGFRSREIGARLEGVRRILAVGDSFGFGHGLKTEEAYPSVLESLLRGYDLLSRYSDRLVVVGLPETDASETRRIAARLLRALEESSQVAVRRLSYALMPDDGASLSVLLERAEERLSA